MEIELEDRFNDPATSDSAIHIQVMNDGTEEIVHVNSRTLAKHSPFFQKLFTTEMRGNSNKNMFVLHVEDKTEIHWFLQLVQYIYSGLEALASSCQEELFYLLMVADKYQVASCISICVDKLKRSQFTREIAVKCLEVLPVTSQVQPLITAAGDYLQKSMRLEHCADLSASTMELVMQSDHFHSIASSEYDVYKMLLRWAEASEVRQQALLTLIEHIRFTNMPSADIKSLQEDLKQRRVPVSESTRKKIKSLSMNGLFQIAATGPRQLVEVGLDEDMSMHVGRHAFAALVDFTKLRVKFWVKLPIPKSYLQRQAREAVAAQLRIPVELQRIWSWKSTLTGPDQVIDEEDTTEVVPPSKGGSVYLYSEVGPAGEKPDTRNHTLIFVTSYERVGGASLRYVGRLFVQPKVRIIPEASGPLLDKVGASEIADQVRELAGCSRSHEVFSVHGDGSLHDLVINTRVKQGSIFCCSVDVSVHNYILSKQKRFKC